MNSGKIIITDSYLIRFTNNVIEILSLLIELFGYDFKFLKLGSQFRKLMDKVYLFIVLTDFRLNHFKLDRESKHEILNQHLLHNVKTGYAIGVEMALRLGADIEINDQAKKTPLIIAIENHHVMAVEVLLMYGADLETIDGYYAMTPLLWALKTCRDSEEIGYRLLDAGSNINVKETNGYTPLIMATWARKDIFHSKKNCLELLNTSLPKGSGFLTAPIVASDSNCHRLRTILSV